MARRDDAVQLLRQGSCPSEIAGRMSISPKTVIQYLRTRVGEGALRLSDIYFSWPPEKREVLQEAGRRRFVDDRLLSANGLSRDDFELFQSLRNRRVFSGDMYEHVTEAEIALHGLVRTVLEGKFGVEESGWWREGILSSIREKCAARREQDDEPCEDPYAYTDLIDIKTIICKNWRLFQSAVPEEYRANRKHLESDLVRLNRIRNSVMHPVKERKWSEPDFEFVRRISQLLGATEPS